MNEFDDVEATEQDAYDNLRARVDLIKHGDVEDQITIIVAAASDPKFHFADDILYEIEVLNMMIFRSQNPTGRPVTETEKQHAIEMTQEFTTPGMARKMYDLYLEVMRFEPKIMLPEVRVLLETVLVRMSPEQIMTTRPILAEPVLNGFDESLLEVLSRFQGNTSRDMDAPFTPKVAPRSATTPNINAPFLEDLARRWKQERG